MSRDEMVAAAAEAVFVAGLPTGAKGDLIPGHTTWDDLGPQSRDRYRRMSAAAVDAVLQVTTPDEVWEWKNQ